MRSKTILLLAVALAACGCSSNKIIVNHDPAADFSRYKTFGFVEKLGTDGNKEYGTLLSQYFKAAVARELEARGYRKSDDPDLLVNFYVQTKDRVESTLTPSMYYGYRGYVAWGGYMGYQETVTEYTEGTLNIDIVEAMRNQLVWEATMIGRVTDKVRENLEQAVDKAVAEVFAKYPYRAGEKGPATGGFSLDGPVQVDLGLMYLKGQTVDRGPQRAFTWFERAARQGAAPAQDKLGMMYEHGRGVEKDVVAAYAWYHLASTQGSATGEEHRARLAQTLAPGQVEEAERLASEWSGPEK